VQNSREIAVLEQAIAVQKKKRWTSWLNAEGLNPLAIGLRIARNVAGGGDRAALQLEIARLELRRAEIATNLRQAVTLAITDDEASGHQQRVLQAKRAALRGRIQLAEVAYRLGEGNTEAMWQFWLTCDELDAQIVAAEAHRQQTRRKLLSLLFPAATALPKFAPRTR
jgi:hypothetical protein